MTDVERLQIIKHWLGAGSINIFGAPFAGKDTHGRELSSTFNAPLIGGGDIIRSHESLHEVKAHIAKGNLAPTDEYLALVLPYFEQTKLKNRPLILSSVGRWYGEHIHVKNAAKKSGHDIKLVVYLDIDEDEVWRRWQKSLDLKDRGKRHDDAEHALHKRLEEFKNKTLPVIGYYKDLGLLLHIDGKTKRSKVSRQIIDGLHQKATAN